MTQFPKRTHRARTKLEAASVAYRWLFEACDNVRKASQAWPLHMYVPVVDLNEEIPRSLRRVGGAESVKAMLGLGQERVAEMVSAGLTWAAWRMTQGIYRFDPALYPALIETPLKGDIPASVLMQLPEWCVYVETPGLTLPSPGIGRPSPALHGAWIRHDLGGRREPLLAISPDTDEGDQIMMPTQHIALGAGSLSDSLQAALIEWVSSTGRDPGVSASKIVTDLESWIQPVLNLVLYLCSDAEYTRRGQPGAPANPAPKRIRRDGWKLFPAQGPAQWDVGVRMGAALRRAPRGV